MRTTSILSSAALSAVALSLFALPSASADGIGVKDARDLDHGVDLRSVVVDHGAEELVVTTTHTNLRPSFRTGSSGGVFLDTDASDPGPEYAFVGGYFRGTDYQLVEVDGFHRSQWVGPVDGYYDMKVDYKRDRVRMTIDRAAIGSPDQVRVAVKVGGSRTDGSTKRLVDWLGEPRTFTDWVAQ